MPTRGLLVIVNGTNFRGVKTLYIGENGLNQLTDWMASGNSTDTATNEDRYLDHDFGTDPNAPPAGYYSERCTGTQLSFTKAAITDINGTWLGSN